MRTCVCLECIQFMHVLYVCMRVHVCTTKKARARVTQKKLMLSQLKNTQHCVKRVTQSFT
jgi:hypothetical protein